MPFFHSSQMEPKFPFWDVGSSSDAENAVIAAYWPIAQLGYVNGAWKIRNTGTSGFQWLALADQEFYVPQGRVRAVSVGIVDPSGSPDNYYGLAFDMPYPNPKLYNFSDASSHPAAHGNYDIFATGVYRPCWLTRVRFNSRTTCTLISLWG